MKNIVCSLVVMLCAVASCAGDRPNVVMIAVDDMCDWIEPLGSSMAKTPNLDRLARQGAVFSNAHTAGIYCAPSRSAIFTGRYASTTGCYNNQVYSNTGTQRSGATPLHAQTTTTWYGKTETEKMLDLIVAAHEPAYQATANSSYPRDLYDKFRKARDIEGPKFIHIFLPCPQAWNYPVELGVEVGKLAVETGYWIMWEREGDKFTLGKQSKRFQDPEKRKPIEEFLKLQGRFSRLFKPKRDEKKIQELQDYVQHRWDLVMKTFT